MLPFIVGMKSVRIRLSRVIRGLSVPNNRIRLTTDDTDLADLRGFASFSEVYLTGATRVSAALL